jgi:hypothetical protein
MAETSNSAPHERDRHGASLDERFDWHRIRRLSRKG